MNEINNNQIEDFIVSDFNYRNEVELIEEEKKENFEINLENQIYSQAIYNFDYLYNYFS